MCIAERACEEARLGLGVIVPCFYFIPRIDPRAGMEAQLAEFLRGYRIDIGGNCEVKASLASLDLTAFMCRRLLGPRL